MSRNSVASMRWRSEMIDDTSLSLSGDHDDVHVLAVDDSLVDRKVIERLLKISSCKVTAVDSGIRALEFLGLDGEKRTSGDGLESLKVDLIITDYCMPGMTGYELLKKIKQSSTFREIPVVIMSSENIMARIDRCLEEGAEDFIVKPVKLSDVKRIRDYMATRENRARKDEKGSNFNKRKLRHSCELYDLPPSPESASSKPLATQSILSSPVSCSPSALDSPTMRLRMSSSQ